MAYFGEYNSLISGDYDIDDEARILGDVGVNEKLALESAFRDAGLDTIACTSMAGVWSNVVHLKCRYSNAVYDRLREALLVLPDGSMRESLRARFLVALGLRDFPSLTDA